MADMLMVLVKPPGNGTGYSVLRHKIPDIDAAIEVLLLYYSRPRVG